MFGGIYNRIQLAKSIGFLSNLKARVFEKLWITQSVESNPFSMKIRGIELQCGKEEEYAKNKTENDIQRERAAKIRVIKNEIARKGTYVKGAEMLSLSDKDMEILLTMDGISRTKYYSQLSNKQRKQALKPVLKDLRRVQNAEAQNVVQQERANNQHLVYALGHNSMFLRMSRQSVRRHQDRRLFRAKLMSQKFIIDCSFNQDLSFYGQRKVAKQMTDCLIANRSNSSPFDLHFCNFDATGETATHLAKVIPSISSPTSPLDLHKECFTELFPKDRLVYLTPDGETELTEYSSQDIFVVGSISSLHESRQTVLARAKESGIRMARLPLATFLKWNHGDKALTPAELVKILLTLKAKRDWQKAFQTLNSAKFFVK